MKPGHSAKRFFIAGNRIGKALLFLVTIALIWQSSFGFNLNAMAAPQTFLATSAAHQVEGAADEVRNRSKDLIQDTKKKVQKTANRNASKVDQADDSGSFVKRKARRDRSRIEQRAEEDASHTERAVDDSMNAIKGVVENIKDAFGS